MTANQLYFTNSNSTALSGSIVLVIENSQSATENVEVVMYLSLMRSFNFSAEILSIDSNFDGALSSLSLYHFILCI